MAMIYVRVKEGRRGFWEGREIPHDKFVPVPDTPLVRRFIHHWEDWEVEGGSEKLKPITRPPVPKPAS